MPRSLRAKLGGAFALVIFLSLALSGSAFVLLLREYQTQLAVSQLSDLALPVSYQVGVLERAGANADQIGSFLKEQANEVDVRIFLIDREGAVIDDTADELEGHVIQVHSPVTPTSGYRRSLWGMIGTSQGVLLVVAPEPRVPRPGAEPLMSNSPTYTIALALPIDNVISGWWKLAPMLSFAAIVALVFSTIVSYFLARSISGPIAQVTLASEAMARGNYNQNIPVTGSDEVAMLALSFNKMASEVSRSNQTLRDFLANITHELRTPLTSIQGFSQAMVDGSLHSREDYDSAGEIIAEEAERMRCLVDDLLAISRLQSGQIKMELREISISSLLESALRRVSHQAQRGTVTTVLRIDQSLNRWSIIGDEHWLSIVLGNLLENAVRFTPAEGVVTISAFLASDKDEGSSGNTPASLDQRVVIEVHNTGSLIPADDLPRVFERFYQVDHSRSTEGSGLGLAIVQEIVAAHGGKVEAMSSESDGTTFRVAFRAALAEIPENENVRA